MSKLLSLCVALTFLTLASAFAQTPSEAVKSNSGQTPHQDDRQDGDPVILSTGEFLLSETDLSIRTRGGTFSITRQYGSRRSLTTPAGKQTAIDLFQSVVREYSYGPGPEPYVPGDGSTTRLPVQPTGLGASSSAGTQNLSGGGTWMAADLYHPPAGPPSIVVLDPVEQPITLQGIYYYHGLRIDKFRKLTNGGFGTPHGLYGKFKEEGAVPGPGGSTTTLMSQFVSSKSKIGFPMLRRMSSWGNGRRRAVK